MSFKTSEMQIYFLDLVLIVPYGKITNSNC